MSRTKQQYATFTKPLWAPPSWIFGPVWSVLYMFIAVSFGFVFYQFYMGGVGFGIALTFLINLIANALYSPLQFKVRSFVLASIDILIVLFSLLIALISIYPIIPWVAYINIPYLLWVSFATVLQLAIARLNKKI